MTVLRQYFFKYTILKNSNNLLNVEAGPCAPDRWEHQPPRSDHADLLPLQAPGRQGVHLQADGKQGNSKDNFKLSFQSLKSSICIL